jgi:hypothetical protein
MGRAFGEYRIKSLEHAMASATSSTINPARHPVAGVSIPDTKLAREVIELVNDTESPLLFHHSSRVYYWGALTASAAVCVSIPSCFP